ncbi:PAS and helix-turn-helix domain-containing protein [Moellerella wisconsensis]|uniref:Helix-turn-helix transcriptional regulator n=2 Tax=Moellerella wisconsensis TaxID=158849 RepID=A0A9Q8Q1F9_9GAMM|nr:PAS and helix-turn-helix domain-containing protein [Moellerella wisconsensis]UNH23661.1 helix-turn-helix transcriptional regulator [Moellerella wisconsensis]UNH26749.1 helix-turn-helix transcriptional regulator [Moellerella wisconsensis]UNH30232.1 helix-turn-helix transcriptional regulator [Moellerella wisconsensis]UNH41906.1 helix-turn-helix transcriptional regulator [Moellerella wisconsensis]
MNNFNINNLPADMINTFEMSQDAWGIKDKNSNFAYVNTKLKNLHSLSNEFDYEGLSDGDIPWNGSTYYKEHILHDQTTIKKNINVTSLETHHFSKENNLSSYLCEKMPFYDENGICQGLIFHARQAHSYCLNRLFRGKLPGSLMFTPPVETISAREWDVIFLFIHRYTSKQIGNILNISYRTVENHFAAIYRKIGIHKASQFLEYCYEHDFDLYVPEHFVKSGSRLLFKE